MPTCPDTDFLRSTLTPDSEVFPLDGFDAWFQRAIDRHRFKIEEIPFSALEKWGFEPQTGNLVHDSGKFFRIEGIFVETNFGNIPQWSQPIINQPEVGLLGIIVKKINGVPHFLMQAKMEPGNINMIQLAPTLQATKSNYTLVHKGKSPPFLEYFRNNPSRKTLVDVLQSEQGGRFLRKRNRNIIVELPESSPLPDSEDYIWLTLGQISQLLRRNNVINMDARTVISCISFHRSGQGDGDLLPDDSRVSNQPADGELTAGGAMHTMDEILTWFTEIKCRYDLNVERIPLKYVSEWQRTDHQIYHPTGNYFAVIAVRVEADNREVATWTQPLVKPCREGLIALIIRSIRGVTHFLIQAKVEPGNFDVVEMAPTVQCLTGDYKKTPPAGRPPLLDYVLSAPKEAILLDTMQSEEGGRFYREENRNLVVLVGDHFQETVPDNFIWVSYTQLKTLIRFNNIVNIQCRCLLSCIGPGFLN